MRRKEQIDKAAYNIFHTIIMRAAFIEGANWADEHPLSPWISVEDKLPPLRMNVVVSTERMPDTIFLSKRLTNNVEERDTYEVDKNGFDLRERHYFAYCDNVKYWMPVPTFPDDCKETI